jgi:hypothetical protein
MSVMSRTEINRSGPSATLIALELTQQLLERSVSMLTE